MRHIIATGIIVSIVLLAGCSKDASQEVLPPQFRHRSDSSARFQEKYGFWDSTSSSSDVEPSRNPPGTNNLDTRLAGIDIGNNTLGKLFGVFGKIDPVQEVGDVSYCYRFPENKFLNFYIQNGRPKNILDALIIEGNLLGKPLKGCAPPINDKMPLATGKGIQLGDSLDKVMEILGPPSLIESFKANEKKLHYNAEPASATYFFENDKLVWVSMYNGWE